jgi:hypothetical protein
MTAVTAPKSSAEYYVSKDNIDIKTSIWHGIVYAEQTFNQNASWPHTKTPIAEK